MTSAIDPTVPVFGTPTTASVRSNFSIAGSEITALQRGTFTPAFAVNRPLVGGATAVVSSSITTDDGTTLTVSTQQVIGTVVTSPPVHCLTVNAASTTPQAVPSVAPQVWVAQEGQAEILVDGYGTAGTTGLVNFRRARGTAAAPTAVLAGDNLGTIGGIGRGATGYSAGFNPRIDLAASENWSDIAQGTRIGFATTTPGAVSGPSVRMTVGQGVQIGNVIADPGNQNLGVANAIIVGGTSTASAAWMNSSPAGNAISFVSGPNNTPFVFFSSTPTTVVQFNTTTPFATLNTSGAWGTISDPRTKSDIEPYAQGLAAVLQLEPISFRYNGELGAVLDGPEVTRYGLDASVVQGIMPELVSKHTNRDIEGNAFDEILVLENGPLIYALVNAVKELSAEVEALKSKLPA